MNSRENSFVSTYLAPRIHLDYTIEWEPKDSAIKPGSGWAAGPLPYTLGLDSQKAIKKLHERFPGLKAELRHKLWGTSTEDVKVYEYFLHVRPTTVMGAVRLLTRWSDVQDAIKGLHVTEIAERYKNRQALRNPRRDQETVSTI